MKPISIIIVDIKSSKKLEQLLSNHSEITILEKVNKIEPVFYLHAKYSPDIVFVDIENIDKKELDKLLVTIRKGNSFNLLVLMGNKSEKKIDIKTDRKFSYIQKPITHTKINNLIKQFHIDRTRSEVVFQTACPFCKKNGDRLMIPVMTGLKNVVISEISYIEKNQDNPKNILIYTNQNGGNPITACLSIMEIAKMLSTKGFFQINRNIIINTEYLLEVETKSKRCVISRNEDILNLPISKSRLKEFREYFNSFLLKGSE